MFSRIISIYMHDCGFQKSRNVEVFLILNFVVLCSTAFKLYSKTSLYRVFEYLVIHCLHLIDHNTLNSLTKNVGNGKLS